MNHALDRIRRVHELVHSTAIMEHILGMYAVILPCGDNPRIAYPIRMELYNSLACLPNIHHVVYDFEILREMTPIFAWHINEMSLMLFYLSRK